MGSISAFPRIKEVRTFLIDGVGSGGDYHNVSKCAGQLNEYFLTEHCCAGQRWSLVNRQ